MNSPRIGSLCSGYGGLEMGLIAAIGGSVAWHVEYDKHPSAVLEARFPGVPNYGDVTTTDWTQVEPVDWLTAGYPCQPFSHAGKRKGSADERHLWPAVADAIGVLRPRRVLLENVAGHISLGLDAVLADLATLGYDTRWGVVRAADAGAPHNRARIFIVAADADDGGSRPRCAGSDGWSQPVDSLGARQPAADADGGRLEVSSELNGDTSQDSADGDSCRGHADGRGVVATDAASARTADEPPRSYGGVQALRSVSGTSDGDSAGHHAAGASELGRGATVMAPNWGAYEAAIRRWELILGRPAPGPTEPGRAGERLSARFVEWMQGLPDGWVTDVLPRNPALKALGNGVVPQQAALAVRTLLGVEAAAA